MSRHGDIYVRCLLAIRHDFVTFERVDGHTRTNGCDFARMMVSGYTSGLDLRGLMRTILTVSFLIASVGVSSQTAAPAAKSSFGDGQRPLASLPYTPGLYLESMDKTADPCVDFYQYSCGGWMKNNPIPADQASWSVYGKLTQENQQFLWGILDDLSKKTSGRNQNQQKIGDYFAACMDESAIEKLGLRPIQPYLAEIDGITSKQQLPALLAEGSGSFFGFGARQDFGDSTQVIAFASAGGLGLPTAITTPRRTQSRLNFGRNTDGVPRSVDSR